MFGKNEEIYKKNAEKQLERIKNIWIEYRIGEKELKNMRKKMMEYIKNNTEIYEKNIGIHEKNKGISDNIYFDSKMFD